MERGFKMYLPHLLHFWSSSTFFFVISAAAAVAAQGTKRKFPIASLGASQLRNVVRALSSTWELQLLCALSKKLNKSLHFNIYTILLPGIVIAIAWAAAAAAASTHNESHPMHKDI